MNATLKNSQAVTSHILYIQENHLAWTTRKNTGITRRLYFISAYSVVKKFLPHKGKSAESSWMGPDGYL